MNEGPALRSVDHLSPRLLDARARQDAEARSDLFDAGLGQAAEEILVRHIRQMNIGAQRLAGDSRHEAAVAMPERARENARQHLPGDDAQTVRILAELAALGDRLDELRPGRMG
jgi:hypothetical protein